MPLKVDYPAIQFNLWRSLTALYVLVYTVLLWPYAGLLYSNSGISKDYTHSISLLSFSSSEIVVYVFLSILIASSLLLFIGKFSKTATFITLFVLNSLYNKNPLSESPELFLIGWLLFATLFITPPDFSLSKKRTEIWQIPKSVLYSAWIVLGVAYCYSGYTKLLTPSWLTGEAMYKVLNGQLAFSFTQAMCEKLPFSLYKYSGFIVVWAELIAPLLFIKEVTRKWSSYFYIFLHINILIFIDLTQVSLGMLLFHLFIFNYKWLPEKLRHSLF